MRGKCELRSWSSLIKKRERKNHTSMDRGKTAAHASSQHHRLELRNWKKIITCTREVFSSFLIFNLFLPIIRIICIPNYFYWLTCVLACMQGSEFICLAHDFDSCCNTDTPPSTSTTWLNSSLCRDGTR